MRDRQIKWLFRITILLLGLLTIYVFFMLHSIWDPFFLMFKAIFIPFLISGFITYLLHPVIEKLHHTGLPRSLSILIIYLLFFGIIGYGFYRGVPVLVNQLRDLSENFPQFSSTYNHWIDSIHDQTNQWPEGIHERIEGMFQQTEEWLAITIEKLINSLKGIFDYMLLIAIIPFLVFYMLKDYDQLKKAAWYLTPRKWRNDAVQFIKELDHSLGNYIRGQLFVCIIIGSLASLSLWIFKVKYPLILGLLIGATNIIPYFGPLIGAVPALIIAATMSTKTVMIVIVLILSLQFIEGNILGPLVVGKSLHMHPIVIMLALLAGGEIGGVIGLMIAVPIVVILRVMIIHFVQLKRRH
ncbi:AI-2E family transporter [Metabacillus sediminilitoris]|uniref:AI-2E family transporter n=1 Tax=Metabacillus sediminilitoris TaxID=2567941 RepID=A0A4S4C7M5_9BACI|nr:AI-2E family transporter [Metabacillus sediminilitoris]QGQ47364.1 AI-2E family transporter [Metabacillus sediminilitoris]THF81799.1 AI-2E family transporter [Metabacillus sediminilitoris]